VLGLPLLGQTPGQNLTFQVGDSRLIFSQAPQDWRGVYHFAINVPEEQFYAAKDWISSKTGLLKDGSGADEFHFASWNAHALYFSDPAGNIVELIARHDLDHNQPGDFSPEFLLNISEIGLASDDVAQTCQSMQAELGWSVYRDSQSDDFVALGDPHGLLILVRRGRVWYPDTGKAAQLNPVRVDLLDIQGHPRQLVGFPYHFK
jgi:catechol-2,3-dioxygenase